jgi:hypothetical protein
MCELFIIALKERCSVLQRTINSDQQAILKPSASIAHCKLNPICICNAATTFAITVISAEINTQRASVVLLRAAKISNAKTKYAALANE